jgi:transmembrane sensor
VFVRRALLGGAVAAAAAGYVVVRPTFGLWPRLQELAADYRTKKGEQRTISVASGVSLELGTQTSIALHASQEQPKIELISGEAVVKAMRRRQILSSCWRLAGRSWRRKQISMRAVWMASCP